MADQIVNQPSHAYDETGTLPENRIENEKREPKGTQYRGLFARFGAFYADSLIIRDANGVVVTKDKYEEALFRPTLSGKVAANVIAAVVITDDTLPSPFYMDYQCVGGPFGASNEVLMEMYEKLNTDDRPVLWGSIIGKPKDGYKPAHHLQDIGDLYGAEYWVAVMERMADLFLMGDNASHDEIWRRIDQIRIEFQELLTQYNNNLRAYIDQQDRALGVRIDTLNDRVSTIHQELLQSINQTNAKLDQVTLQLQANINTVDRKINNHIADKNNPHETSAAQTGAYSQANGELLAQRIANHLLDMDNPHQTTSAQTGALSQADGRAISERLTNHVNDKDNPHETTFSQTGAASPASVTLVANALANHVNDKSNPHETTFGQTGAASPASVTAVSNALANHLLDKNNPHETNFSQTGAASPASVTAVMNALTNHINDKNNPHETTPAKIGAMSANAGQALNDLINAHIANKNNPHETSFGQTGAASPASVTAVDNRITNHINDKNNPHETTPAKIGALSQADGDILKNIIISHTVDKNNPHETTPQKIGAVTIGEYNTSNAWIINNFSYYVRLGGNNPDGSMSTSPRPVYLKGNFSHPHLTYSLNGITFVDLETRFPG